MENWQFGNKNVNEEKDKLVNQKIYIYILIFYYKSLSLQKTYIIPTSCRTESIYIETVCYNVQSNCSNKIYK